MDSVKRTKLRKVLNSQFEQGINKQKLLIAMEMFIDWHYDKSDDSLMHEVRVLSEKLDRVIKKDGG